MILSLQKMVEQLRIKEEKRGFVGQPLKVYSGDIIFKIFNTISCSGPIVLSIVN